MMKRDSRFKIAGQFLLDLDSEMTRLEGEFLYQNMNHIEDIIENSMKSFLHRKVAERTIKYAPHFNIYIEKQNRVIVSFDEQDLSIAIGLTHLHM